MQPRFHIWDCMGPQSLTFCWSVWCNYPNNQYNYYALHWDEISRVGWRSKHWQCHHKEMCICGWLGTGMMYLCVWVAYRLHKQMLSATDCAHIQLPACCPAVPSWLPAARYWIFVNFGQATRYVAFLESLKYTQNACFVLNASRSAFEILD